MNFKFEKCSRATYRTQIKSPATYCNFCSGMYRLLKRKNKKHVTRNQVSIPFPLRETSSKIRIRAEQCKYGIGHMS